MGLGAGWFTLTNGELVPMALSREQREAMAAETPAEIISMVITG